MKVNADSAEYSEIPGGPSTSLLSFAKSRVTDEPYKAENETVSF